MIQTLVSVGSLTYIGLVTTNHGDNEMPSLEKLKIEQLGDLNNSFARSICDQFWAKKRLSDKQWYWVDRLLSEAEEASVVVEDDAPQYDLQAIRDKFETARASGYKRPVYRAEGIVLKRAPDHGNNPGALYVTDEATGDYLGKIVGVVYKGKPAAETALSTIAADPLGAAIAYGRRTGNCACCGRTLTKGESIDRGIGPICAERWGM